MFRITTRKREKATWITLDGRLEDSDIDEVNRAFSSVTGPVELNLSDLESCSAAMVRELRRWLDAGVRLNSATPFLRMLLSITPEETQPLKLSHRR